MSISGIVNSHLIMAMTVQRNGTEEQKKAFLPRFATGELRGGVGLTEPDAGTDLQAIRTVAKREGDQYVVNGTKMWITNSMYGNCLALLVKTDPKAEPRHKGMSLLIAEKGEGFIVSKKLEKLGYKGIDTCALAFENYRVPADRLIGGVEGKGLQQILGGPGARSHQRGRARPRCRAGRARRRPWPIRRCARPSASRSASTRRSS
jgi:alkylation response protein AidB-like acyl-CoA dehydrogenase